MLTVSPARQVESHSMPRVRIVLGWQGEALSITALSNGLGTGNTSSAAPEVAAA